MQPTAVDNPVQPFLFFRETKAGDNNLVLDNRVRVERVTVSPRAGGAADLTLRFNEDRLADDTIVEPELTDAMIRERYSPIVRCGVAQAPPVGGSVNDLAWLIHGYVEVPQLRFGAAGGRRFFTRSMKVRDIFTRWARREDAWVQGRYMLSRTGWQHAKDNPAQDPLFLPWSNLAALVQSLPCIFNPNGRPNRMATPAFYDVPSGWSPGPVHLFTTDDDPNAEYWTYLQALRYLLLIHLPYGGDAFVSPGDVFFDDAFIGPGGSEWWKLDENDVALAGDVPDGWKEHMTRRCHSLATDGLDLLDALVRLCTACGIDFEIEHRNAPLGGNPGVLSKFAFWAPGDKTNAQLALEKTGSHFKSPGKSRDVSEILANNNVQNCESARDVGSAVAVCKVLGDAQWRTVMAELVPLWEPDAMWDSVADPTTQTIGVYDSEEGAYASTKDTDFYKRFHAQGELFGDDANAMIGRLWGVDPAGELDAATYNRHAPWNAAYGNAWAVPGEPDEVPRRRNIRAIPTAAGHTPLGVPLEISFDGDAGVPTWHALQTRGDLLPTRSAIYLRASDLLAVGSDILRRALADGNGYGVDNFYDAYLQGKLRLRAGFQVQLDRRLEAEASSSGTTALPTQGIAALVMRGRDFLRTDDDAGVPAYIFDHIRDDNDQSSALEFAKLLIADRAGGRWSGRFTIPWVELDVLGLGTPVEGIRRVKGGAVEIPFGGSAAAKGRYPTVVQKIYSNGRNGVATEVVLGDFRFSQYTAPASV